MLVLDIRMTNALHLLEGKLFRTKLTINHALSVHMQLSR